MATLAHPLPLVLIAAAAGLAFPSDSVAERADLLLAVLVLAIALTIDPARLVEARRAARQVAAATLLPLVVLLPLAVALGALFEDAERDGLLALGLASSEVAVVALVALAGGAATAALAVVTLSLVLTAVVAPVIAPLLSDASIDAGELAVRFSLVVLVPLALGLAVRSRLRGDRVAAPAETAATVVLALLVYAGLSDLGELSGLGPSALAAGLFLLGSTAIAALLGRWLGELRTGGLAFALRDFAVAATLAAQLGTEGAAATPAVYGVLMLVLATGAAPLLGRRATVA